MAMVKLDGNVVAIEGKSGGTVFRKDVCGQHAQKVPRTVKSRTPEQLMQQTAFGAASEFCHGGDWTDEDYQAWLIYCQNHLRKNKKGEYYRMSPISACIHINTIRYRNALTMTPVPPK